MLSGSWFQIIFFLFFTANYKVFYISLHLSTAVKQGYKYWSRHKAEGKHFWERPLMLGSNIWDKNQAIYHFRQESKPTQ